MTAKQTAIATVLGSALAMAATTASPLAAAPPEKAEPKASAPAKSDAAEIAALKKKLGEANKEILRLAGLLEGVKDQPSLPGALHEITQLKDKVFAQSEKIASLQKQVDEMKKSTSLKPAPAPAAKKQATVQIINEYPIEVTILVNAKTYRVAPNTKLDIPVGAGEFSYQLWSTGTFLAPVKGPIGAGELVKLRIK